LYNFLNEHNSFVPAAAGPFGVKLMFVLQFHEKVFGVVKLVGGCYVSG